LRFELAWLYPYNVRAGEHVFILRRDAAERALADLPVGDFWLFDDAVAVEMEYDSQGRFIRPVRASEDELGRYSQLKDAALREAVPFEVFR
jgi:hypothetical protein